MRIALPLLALILVSPLPAQAQAAGEPPFIETVGTGQRRVAPDRANVHLIVETRATTAAVAASQNSRAVAAVIDTLRKAGIDSSATTASYHVGANYEPIPVEPRGEPRQRGYIARTVLRVRPSRIENVGRAIDVGLSRGATGVEQVYFESSRAEEERRTALAEAATAARREAEVLARSLGGSLGRLLSVTTAGAPDPRRINMAYGSVAGEAMMRATAISPNDIVIAAAVVTRWQFVSP